MEFEEARGEDIRTIADHYAKFGVSHLQVPQHMRTSMLKQSDTDIELMIMGTLLGLYFLQKVARALL